MVSLAISGRPSAGASALARVVLPLAGGPDTTTYLPGGHRSVTRLLSRPDAATAAARSGPCRLTALAAHEGVTQPAMTQLVDRLQGAGLLDRVPDPADGRAVQVRITGEGRALLARRRAVRAERVAGLLARLSPGDQALLTAALPALEALANTQRPDARAGPQQPA
jgi:DNA-binding MarR family transcriptional regulator